MTDLQRIEQKLDLIIDSFGLSEKHKLSPVEIKQLTDKMILNFEEKKRKKSRHGSQENP